MFSSLFCMYAHREEQCTFRKDVYPAVISSGKSVGYRDESLVHSREYQVENQHFQENVLQEKCRSFLHLWSQYASNEEREYVYASQGGFNMIAPLEIMFPRLLSNPLSEHMFGKAWIQPALINEVTAIREDHDDNEHAGLTCLLPGTSVLGYVRAATNVLGCFCAATRVLGV